MAYQPGIPTGSVPLNQDYLNIQGNFSSLNTQFNVDHVPLTDTSGTPPNGYHTFVHLVPFSTTTTNPPNNQPVVAPAATVGYGQLFGAKINDGINTDQALYYLSGGNRLTQLTRNIQPLTAANGYSFLPGGMLIQWGVSTANVLHNFLQAFKAATTPVMTLGVSNGASISTILTLNNTSYQVNGPAGSSFNWIAIGQ